MDEKFQYDIENREFNEAFDFVMKKSGNLFLTGRAGTGKTTFLRHIKSIIDVETVVAAPTGIAAINAGGVTVHSFFQIPFGPLPPNDPRMQLDYDKPSNSPILKAIHFRSKKKNIIKKMKLLIIDEVSMIRVDVLDAIDLILRAVTGKTDLPFGGKQVLLIGDVFQLPPVTNPQEDEILGPHYKSPFFFDSKVFTDHTPAVIELKKIYRQHDKDFIELLNKVRNNSINDSELTLLNDKYNPAFTPEKDEPYILISTHNASVDKVNKVKLAGIEEELHGFEGEVDGEFGDKLLPTKKILDLKIGAQVMFLRNDLEKEKRYYNGTIGLVHEFKQDCIVVKLEDGILVELGKEKWENIKYTWNEKEKKIDTDIIGEFLQFPLKLAWAITVHKSQGLTFDKVILDISRCFAPGQTYVALSRCREFDGIVLKTKIPRYSIKTAAEVIEFEKMYSEFL